MTRKSLVVPTLLTLCGFVLLVGLGVWQLQRLAWKEGLIAERAAATSGVPVALPRTLAAARALDFHRVAAAGTFAHDHELYLHATTADGAAGYHVLTPLALADGASVMVDRGFVPDDRKAPASRAGGNQAAAVTVTGLLRLPTKPGWFVPDNRPERNEWFFVDLAAMAAATGSSAQLPFYVDADATPNPGGFPIGGQTPLELPNNHLQYAITWFALAVALLAVYMLWRRRRTGERM